MSNNPVDAEAIRMFRHEVRNQLSGIHLALEALQREVPENAEDFNFCLETIFNSAEKINDLLKDLG